MSEMNKDFFEKSFEAQWQDAFEGAELSPHLDLWDKIESQLPPNPTDSGGRQGYFVYSTVFLAFLGVFFMQKTSRVAVAEKTTVPKIQKTQTIHAQASILPIQENSTNGLQSKITVIVPASAYSVPTQKPIVKPVSPTNNTLNVLPAQTAEEDALPTYTSPAREQKARRNCQILLKNLRQIGKKTILATQKSKSTKPATKENAVEAKTLMSLGLIILPPSSPKLQDFNIKLYPETHPNQIEMQRFWVSVQRGFAFASPKFDIRYENYVKDYAKLHNLEDNADLSNFFTETSDNYMYRFSNQADIRLGYYFSPKWEFSAGVQYRTEFVEQTSNAFFVNYYDYSRHSFLLDILEGNITSSNFAQAIQHHPSYRANGENIFNVSQFNQQDLIHLSSRFEYVGIPMQIGYTLKPFKKLGIVLIGAAQVDKLIRSSTSSYELRDDVENVYKLKTATKLSTWSWQIGGGVQAEYKFNRKWSLTTSALAFENIKPIKENKYVIIRPRGLQLNFGTKYMF
jgi:hypothetical protein